MASNKGRNLLFRQKVGKKQQLIHQVQAYWNLMDKKRIKTVAETFGIAQLTAKKYVNMSEADINCLDVPVDMQS